MTKELTLTDRARKALANTVTEQALQNLADKYADLTTVNSKTDLSLAMSALGEFRSTRTAITKAGKDARDDANAFCKAVIAEEKRLIGIIQPEESRIQEVRKEYEEEQERIKREAEEKERQRIAAHKDRLNRIIATPACSANLPAVEIEQRRTDLEALEIGEKWEEFRAEAQTERAKAVAMLTEMADRARAAEAAEAERQRREAEEAEHRRKEAEELAKQKAEQDRMAAELRKQQEEIARQQAELRAQQEAEQRRQADEIERQKREAEEQERQRQAAIEAEQRQKEERAKQEAEAKKKAKARKPKEPAPIPEIRAWAEHHGIADADIGELLEIIQPYLQKQAA